MSAMRWGLVLAAAGALSCAHAPKPPEAPRYRAADFAPLAVGNEWVYESSQHPGEKRVAIVGTEGAYFVHDDPQKSKLRHDALGVRDEKRYLLQEPLARGTSWTSVVSVSSTERFEIVDTGFTTTTPAGVFTDCVRVRAVNRIDATKELRAEWTFAPGVGLVRIATVAKASGREIPVMELDLKRYKVKAKQ
jgi:hypothetical protein